MPSNLVEKCVARGAKEDRLAGELGIRGADAGGDGRRLPSIYVPEDEICFFTFEAPSGRDPALAGQQAGLDALRVMEADSSGKEQVQ